MNKAQIKRLNKRVDQLFSRKRLPTLKELGIPTILIEKYGLSEGKKI